MINKDAKLNKDVCSEKVEMVPIRNGFGEGVAPVFCFAGLYGHRLGGASAICRFGLAANGTGTGV